MQFGHMGGNVTRFIAREKHMGGNVTRFIAREVADAPATMA